MKYGIHTALVKEVIDLAKEGDLLRGDGTNANWHIIHDLDEAKRFAWETTIGPDEYLWTDLREGQMADVIGRSYEVEQFADVDESLTGTLKLFTAFVRRKLDAEHSELLNDIVGDLQFRL